MDVRKFHPISRRRVGQTIGTGGLQPAMSFLFGACLALVLTFLILPVVAIFASVSPSRLVASLASPVARDALVVSLEASAAALLLLVLVATPAAYLLATRNFKAKPAVLTAVELPLVLPPAVAGIGLLAAFGPQGLLGGAFSVLGISLPLSRPAVVLALAFVASPLYMRQAQSAFAGVDYSLVEAARTLGASPARTFARVMLPLARTGLGAAVALSLGRALGEFGATLMFAGSFQGVTQTLPLAIYASFGQDFPAALAMSAVLVAVSASVLLGAKLWGARLVGDA